MPFWHYLRGYRLDLNGAEDGAVQGVGLQGSCRKGLSGSSEEQLIWVVDPFTRGACAGVDL